VKKAAPAADVSTQAAPVKKAGGGIIDKIKQGFTPGQGEQPAAAASTTAAPAANPAAPTADPAAEKAAKIGVGQINKIIPTLRTRDLMSLQANLEKTIASKKKAAPAAPAADATTTTAPAAPGSDAAKDELYGAGNRPKGAKDKVAALKSQNKKKAVAPSQADIDADRERNIGMTSDSVIRKGRVVAEGFSLYRKY
jgi:hypothetical protein